MSKGLKASRHFDVAIVGFGPIGAIAACWLGQSGIKTLVIEKSATIWEIPRAVALDHEILRVFQNIGVIDKVLPYTAPFGASEHFGTKGQLIRRIDVVASPYPLGYLPNVVFTQPAVEKILRGQVASHPSVQIALRKELTALEQRDNLVNLTIQGEDGTEIVKATYVVACDGASSVVRRLLDIALDDLVFDEPWLVVDLHVNHAALSKLPQVCAQYCDPSRPYTYIIGPGNHRRWEIMMNPGEEPRQMEQEENVWRLLSRWLDPADGQLWRASSYRFHALVASRWRDRRVFLAGDAAHQQPPFLGQGMCQGVRDVSNLCWKLKAVLSGQAQDKLLETYEPERSQHVRTLTQRIKQIGASICERDLGAAHLRDVALLETGGGKAPIVTRQEIVPALQSGLIAPEHGPAAGTIFPQPKRGITLMDVIAGSGWRLVVDGRTTQVIPPIDQYEMDIFFVGGVHSPESEGVAAAWFDKFGCVAAVVRPDHYVYCGLRELSRIGMICRDLQSRVGGPPFPGAPIKNV